MLISGHLAPRPAAADHTSSGDVMALHAKDLFDQIERKSALAPGLGRKIAIWSYAPDEALPISHERARSLNDRLEHALQELSEGKYDFKGRRDLRTVIRELAESGGDVEDPIAVVKANAKADILIVGKFAIERGHIESAYKAFALRDGRSGSILATSRTRALPLGAGTDEVELNQFLRHAARAFVNGARDMTELHLAGIKYQDTGQQPEFGSYMERMLQGEISRAFRAKGHPITVKRAELSEDQLRDMRGAAVDRRRLQPKNFDTRSGIYVLTGTYWDVGESVDIEIRLRDSKGAPLSYRANVVKRSIGSSLKLRPENDLEFLRRNVLRGGVGLRLRSARGRDPVYRLNEKLHLLIEVDRDAWLYCFYLQSNGELYKIYPNNFGKPAVLKAGRLHTIPGRMYPFDFSITKPIGVDLVKCFAAERDVLRDLPKALRRLEVAALPRGTAQRLREVFRRIPDAGVSEAALLVNVNK